MKMRDSRLWVVIIAAAFLAFWCAGVGAAYAAPAAEPIPDPTPSVPSQEVQMVGIVGWCLVGVGFLGVALSVALGSRSRRRRKAAVRTAGPSRRPARVMRSVYTPPPTRRYQRNIERRF